MSTEAIRSQILERFCAMLSVTELGDGSFSLGTPFLFGDGDGFPVVLEMTDGGWRFTDRGATSGHLFFDDIELTDHRLHFIRRVATQDGLRMSDDYEVTSDVYKSLPSPVDVANFIQALARIGAVVSLEREPVERYIATVRDQVERWVPREAATPNWHHPTFDPRGYYPSDLRIVNGHDVVMFFVATDARADRSALSLTKYHEWGFEPLPLIAYRPGLSSRAVYRLQDAARDPSRVARVTPAQHGFWTLQRLLTTAGVPVTGP